MKIIQIITNLQHDTLMLCLRVQADSVSSVGMMVSVASPNQCQ